MAHSRADVIWLNGAFGVGKTTVAERVVDRLHGAASIDPEVVGTALRVMLPVSWQAEDYQEIPAWSALTGTLLDSLVGEERGPLVVPMTVASSDRLSAILAPVRSAGAKVVHVTLTAPVEVIRERLVGRDGNANGWAKGRIEQCVSALTAREFAEHVDASSVSPDALADRIVQLAHS